MIGVAELTTWERLCLSFRLQDAWHVTSLRDLLNFSKSDRRLQGVNMSRLDRMYIDYYFVEKSGEIGILSGSLFSDHAPVIMIVGKKPYHSNSCHRISKWIYFDRSFRQYIL